MGEKITIGIIGAGRIGRLHAENIVHIPKVRIKVISDIFIENVKEWAHQIGIENVTTDYHDILNDTEIDAVLVCSPTSTHVTIIREAARAGKHIFKESFETKKPVKIKREKYMLV